MNPTTNSVHTARTGTELLQACGNGGRQRAYLVATNEPVTCRRCIAAAPKPPVAIKAAPAARKVSGGPATWGVFTADGNLRTFRATRREALAIADGDTVRKMP